MIDALTAGVSLAVLANSTQQTSDAVVIPALVGSLAYSISSAYGEWEVRRCDDTKNAWRVGGAISQAVRPPPPEMRPAVSAAPPRGFYCASSSSVADAGFCTRDKVACITAHDAVVASVADIGDCTLVESAWCFGDGRCSPNHDVCNDQRSKDAATDDEVRDCVEVR